MPGIMIIAASDGDNLVLARKFKSVSEELGVHSEILDLASMDLPLFSNSRRKEDGTPQAVLDLIPVLADTTGWIVCAPEYNGSIPPSLNNLIAWLSIQGDDFRALFNSKKIGLSTHSGGGGAHVIMSMRQQFAFLGSDVLGRAILTNRNKEANYDAIVQMITALS